MTTNTIDLSQLPLPDAVEIIDPVVILAEWIQLLISKDPTYNGLVESDPAYIQGEATSYRESNLRQRVNDAVKAIFLATATGSDLDVKAADYGVPRLLIDPGDPDAIPPRDPVYESDDAFRSRVWLSMQALSVAGPYGAYLYFALSASPDVLDAKPYGPEHHSLPGEVHIYVLSRTGDGTADQALLDAVLLALNDEDVRPLTDYVTAYTAVITTYTIEATLHIKQGPDPQSVKDAALQAAQAYVDSVHRIGQIVAESGIYQALHQPGVDRVTLTAPVGDLIPVIGQAFYCSGITLNMSLET
ncbi:baseplate assembly protein J [Buttiauxella ferragutiae ATCC 51602]|uniref:Baseplate assembly protein J n=1 Tax=Buttiauxella ferragutiae ATCC 51602 TaxID=1354252 RepID=A0ABX2W6Y8_9ENTR|nr:baseplate J/gp47 family protein [Buttiauxella ferragutiae]OAT26727.1 baseplate assembly protein J [Buttiauxella ferragutiae ATCC 51602]